MNEERQKKIPQIKINLTMIAQRIYIYICIRTHVLVRCHLTMLWISFVTFVVNHSQTTTAFEYNTASKTINNFCMYLCTGGFVSCRNLKSIQLTVDQRRVDCFIFQTEFISVSSKEKKTIRNRKRAKTKEKTK